MTKEEQYEWEKRTYTWLIEDYPEGELVTKDDLRVQLLCPDSLQNKRLKNPVIIDDIYRVKYKGDWYQCFSVRAFYEYKGTEDEPLYFFEKPERIHLRSLHNNFYISINDIEEIVTTKDIKNFLNNMTPPKTLWKNTKLSKPFGAKESDILAPYLFRTKSCNAITDSDFTYSSMVGRCYEYLLAISIKNKVPASKSKHSYSDIIDNNDSDVPATIQKVYKYIFGSGRCEIPTETTEYKDILNMYNASVPLISSISKNEPRIQLKCTFGPFSNRIIDLFLNGFILDIKTSANITWLKKYTQQVYEYFLAGTLDYLSADKYPDKIQSPIYRIGLYEARYNQIDYCNIFELPSEKLITDLIQYRDFRKAEAPEIISYHSEKSQIYSEETTNEIFDSVTDEKIKEYIDWFVNTTPPESWFDKYCSLS